MYYHWQYNSQSELFGADWTNPSSSGLYHFHKTDKIGGNSYNMSSRFKKCPNLCTGYHATNLSEGWDLHQSDAGRPYIFVIGSTTIPSRINSSGLYDDGVGHPEIYNTLGSLTDYHIFQSNGPTYYGYDWTGGTLGGIMTVGCLSRESGAPDGSRLSKN